MKKTTMLRKLLIEEDIVVIPGAFDPLSAKFIEAAGFSAVYVSGFACSAAYLAEPDLGLMSITEVSDNIRRICQAVNVPVIADADNGYGNLRNAMRTIRIFENAGLAGLHIEDQVLPKQCGHLAGKQVVTIEEMIQKIKAMVDTRMDPDFLIIARTDSLGVYGFDDALRRCHAYAFAGADMLFVDGLKSIDEISALTRSDLSVPILFNAANTGKGPRITVEEAKALGIKVMIYPIELLMTAYKAIERLLKHIARNHDIEGFTKNMIPFNDFTEFIGMDKYTTLEKKIINEAAKTAKSF